jgi:hypothetical protein
MGEKKTTISVLHSRIIATAPQQQALISYENLLQIVPAVLQIQLSTMPSAGFITQHPEYKQ